MTGDDNGHGSVFSARSRAHGAFRALVALRRDDLFLPLPAVRYGWRAFARTSGVTLFFTYLHGLANYLAFWIGHATATTAVPLPHPAGCFLHAHAPFLRAIARTRTALCALHARARKTHRILHHTVPYAPRFAGGVLRLSARIIISRCRGSFVARYLGAAYSDIARQRAFIARTTRFRAGSRGVPAACFLPLPAAATRHGSPVNFFAARENVNNIICVIFLLLRISLPRPLFAFCAASCTA